MARKITAPFTLTESIEVTAGAFTQDTIDVSSYISVGSRQALQIHKVDFVYQTRDTATDNIGMAWEAFDASLTAVGQNAGIALQLTDLNRGAMVEAADSALIASGTLRLTPSGDSHASDLYPDNYTGPDGRTVVNDQIYFGMVFAGGLNGGHSVIATVRLECQIVELSTADWMAIAIQSTSADN